MTIKVSLFFKQRFIEKNKREKEKKKKKGKRKNEPTRDKHYERELVFVNIAHIDIPY